MASSFKGDKLIGKSNYQEWITPADFYLKINSYMLYIDGSKEKPNKELYYAKAKNGEGAITWSFYSLELAVKYLDKLSEFEEANKKALGALKSIISLENQKRFKDKTSAEDLYEAINETYSDTGLEEVNRYVYKMVETTYSSCKNIDEYTSIIQSNAIYLKEMNCEIPKPVLASLIFKGLPSFFDSFASRKFKEISSNLKEVDIDSLISDLLLEEARMGTSADLKANKAFKNNAKYCSHCKQKGHLNSTCFKLHPELKPNFNKKPNNKAISARDKDFKNGSSKALMSAFTNSSFNSELNHFGIAYSITNNNKFVLDSGALKHYSPNKAWFINYKPIAKKSIIIANSDIMLILSIGDIFIKSKTGLEIIIKNVNYIPKLKTTLISSKELTNKDWAINFDRNGAKIFYASFKPYINVDPFVTTKLGLYYKRLLHVNKDFVLKTIDNSEGLSKAIEQNLENSHIKNRSYNSVIKKTPYEALYGQKPYIGYFKILGSLAYILKNKRDNKLADKDEKRLLVGFESANNYLIYFPSKRVVISLKNVLIKEDLKFKDELINEKSDYFDIIEEELPSTKGDDDFTTSIKSIDNTSNNQPNISQPRVVEIEEAEDQPYFDDTESRASDALSDLNTDDPNKAEALKAPKTRGPAKDYSDQRPNVTIRSSKNNSFNLAITELNNRLIEEQIQAMSVYKNVTLLASMALISFKTDRNLDQGLIKLSDKNSSKVTIKKFSISTPPLEPKSYEEAINSALYKDYWLKSMQNEIDSLESQNTWKVVNKSASNNIKPLKTRWVYKIKQGINSSKYANKLLMLNKALYGLKQSARLWFITLKEVLIQKFSFTPLLADSCILYNKELKLIISVYVDDLALISPNIDTIKSFIKELQKYFKLKDLGLIKDYLGIDIEYDIKRGYMKLSQESYITKILNRFDMLDCKLKPIPMDSKAKLELNPNKASASEITWFQQVIGCLLLLTLATRPDICYAVIKLARFASNPSESHIIGLKNILRYLKGSIKLGLIYQRSLNKFVSGYCDADYAGDIGTAKSTSGFNFYISSSLFSWKSKLQSIIAQSTTEAEYMAINSAAKEAVYIKQLLTELGYYMQDKFSLYTDNNGALLLAKNLVFHERTKHIAVKYHYIRDLINKGIIDLVYIRTLNQKADGFTKALDKLKFNEFVKQLQLS
ncbi:hypothetical protein MBM_09882 [Drepanopeziza brunnea f. sp. 'multigermtubi' MB_m1]|uniref:Uncharacterized protein n=1 Tax=Marssonina brunnea f. sp. multigermtubi (strain MB_m1) TaxID=1072389 RepID=K1WIC8_MARBU|nr:uncharacterized protein MBM_09882 [Drepanopeziza brunnea f. sp. 'multigermtubi' MB_m1]EKD11952.1 hypothetical protein MBM_09882 [Drepanopeziza brunnea f. sp. 'multigermtubi' MB_m1]